MKTRIFTNPFVAIGTLLALSLVAAAAFAADDAGKVAFLANKCNLCHAVSPAGITATTQSEKLKGPDLKGLVAQRGIDEERKWIRRETERNGKKHSKDYKGTPEDLEAILKWLAAQK